MFKIPNVDKLESLNLNGNHFGENGCDEIEDLMAQHGAQHKLEALDEDNDVDEDLEDYEDDKENVSVDEFTNTPTVEGFLALGHGNIRFEIIATKLCNYCEVDRCPCSHFFTMNHVRTLSVVKVP